MKITLKTWGIFLLIFFSLFKLNAQDLQNSAVSKIKDLRKLIKKAEQKNINVLKEETTIRTAEIFLKFAAWDEKNINKNEQFYIKVKGDFKTNAAKLAKDLPNFERKEINIMLDKAINELQSLVDGKIFRQSSVKIDWSKITLENDHLSLNNKPIFINDYTWKPKTKELTEFHGDIDGFYIAPTYVVNQNGKVRPNVLENIENKPNSTPGFVFLNHKRVPKWSEKVYGPNFSMRKNTYIGYDIDNPGGRKLQSDLFSEIVPRIAEKKFSQLGYMLCNEPHFFTQADATKNKLPWASGSVSKYSIQKFRFWLQQKHQNISALNSLWETNFINFKDVEIEIPIDISLQGKPIWFDWMSFNMDRVTDWFQFLKSEITRHDANAKVHVKVMPVLWTNNKRSHGIDLEAITELSGIVGNDSGAEHKFIWGKPHEWDKTYAFDWRELCMGFDFMKSVSPNKINLNSELHYLSTIKSRDLYLDPNYARATFWLAHSYGMDASVIWYWPRKANGEVKPSSDLNGYGGSVTQQPRVTNEVAMTLIDLNSNAEEILKMQRQRKPIRLFYSKTTAINEKKYMDTLFGLYESLHFEGTSLGFVTKNIIEKQDSKNWDVVLVYNTPFVTNDEVKSLQNYLNAGGTVIIDDKSLLKNEYGLTSLALDESKGTLIKLNSITEIKEKTLAILKEKKSLPEIKIEEENEIGKKGCIWKVVKNEKGNQVLSIVNVGKSNAKLKIYLNENTSFVCKDVINGIAVSSTPILKPNEVYFVEVIKN